MRTVLILTLFAVAFAVIEGVRNPLTADKSLDRCSDIKDKDDCLDGTKDSACAWCEGIGGQGPPPTCMDWQAASYIPSSVAKCKVGKGPQDPTQDANAVEKEDKGCMDLTNKDDCVSDDECSWCEGDFLPGGAKCLALKVADLIPPVIATCKHGSKESEESTENKSAPSPYGPPGGGSGGQGGQGCQQAKDKDDCLDKNGCSWCKGFSDFFPPMCLDSTYSQYMPLKCKEGGKKHDHKKHKKHDKKHRKGDNDVDDADADDADLEVEYMGIVSEAAGLVNSAYPGGGSGGDQPYGPGGGGQGQGCQDLKKRKKCLDQPECAWCKGFSEYMPPMCMDASSAYMPGCEKSKKQHDAVAE